MRARHGDRSLLEASADAIGKRNCPTDLWPRIRDAGTIQGKSAVSRPTPPGQFRCVSIVRGGQTKDHPSVSLLRGRRCSPVISRIHSGRSPYNQTSCDAPESVVPRSFDDALPPPEGKLPLLYYALSLSPAVFKLPACPPRPCQRRASSSSSSSWYSFFVACRPTLPDLAPTRPDPLSISSRLVSSS